MWSFIKRYKYVVGCFFLSLLCAISFYLQGGYIDENGILVEAFFLIPLSWLFFVLSVIVFLIIKLQGRKVIIKR